MKNDEYTINLIKEYCLRLPGAYETRPFGEVPICYRIMGKIFAQFYITKDFYKMTLKCSTEQAEVYRQLFPGAVNRGYHCPLPQQAYWNTVELDLFEDLQLLFKMIDEAYDEVLGKFSKVRQRKFTELITFKFIQTDGVDNRFAYLCNKLDKALDEYVGKQFERIKYDKFNQRDSIHDVIISIKDGEPIGCGAFKFYDEEHAELKRIYVNPEYRGMGIGTEIVRRLEAHAKIIGYKYCILETGNLLIEACRMYKKLGYKVIDNYGPYLDMEESVCMGKKI